MTKQACQNRQKIAMGGNSNFATNEILFADGCFGCPQANVPGSNDRLKIMIIDYLKKRKGPVARTKLAKNVLGHSHIKIFDVIDKLIEEGVINTELTGGKWLITLRDQYRLAG